MAQASRSSSQPLTKRRLRYLFPPLPLPSLVPSLWFAADRTIFARREPVVFVPSLLGTLGWAACWRVNVEPIEGFRSFLNVVVPESLHVSKTCDSSSVEACGSVLTPKLF